MACQVLKEPKETQELQAQMEREAKGAKKATKVTQGQLDPQAWMLPAHLGLMDYLWLVVVSKLIWLVLEHNQNQVTSFQITKVPG